MTYASGHIHQYEEPLTFLDSDELVDLMAAASAISELDDSAIKRLLGMDELNLLRQFLKGDEDAGIANDED